MSKFTDIKAATEPADKLWTTEKALEEEYLMLLDAMESVMELQDDELIDTASHYLEIFQENHPEIVAGVHNVN